MSPFLIFLISVSTFLTIISSVESGIEGDAKVVNNGSTALEDRLVANTKNRIDISLGLEEDAKNDRLAVIDNKLIVGDDRLIVIDNRSAIVKNKSAARISNKIDIDDRFDAKIGNQIDARPSNREIVIAINDIDDNLDSTSSNRLDTNLIIDNTLTVNR